MVIEEAQSGEWGDGEGGMGYSSITSHLKKLVKCI